MAMTHKGTVTIEQDGKRYTGEWVTTPEAGGVMTVTLFGYGQKATHIGNTPPEILARMLLRELAKEQYRGMPSRWPSENSANAFGEKTCKCYKSDYRDPECERKHPDICPWRAFDLMMLAGEMPKGIGN